MFLAAGFYLQTPFKHPWRSLESVRALFDYYEAGALNFTCSVSHLTATRLLTESSKCWRLCFKWTVLCSAWSFWSNRMCRAPQSAVWRRRRSCWRSPWQNWVRWSIICWSSSYCCESASVAQTRHMSTTRHLSTVIIWEFESKAWTEIRLFLWCVVAICWLFNCTTLNQHCSLLFYFKNIYKVLYICMQYYLMIFPDIIWSYKHLIQMEYEWQIINNTLFYNY